MTWFLLASCSALLSAGAAIMQKKLLFQLRALEFSFLLSIVILIFSAFVPFTTDVLSIQTWTTIIIVGKSMLSGVAFLLVMLSLEHNQISSALPLLGITPAVTALIAIPFLGESLSHWEWTGLGLMVVGTYLLEKRPAQKLFQPLKTVLISKSHYYIFGAVGLFAVSSVLDKTLVGTIKVDPAVVLFYQHIIYCLMFGVLLVRNKSPLLSVIKRGKEHLPFIVAIALLTIVYRYTQLEATKLGPVAMVLAVKRTSILFASFFGGKLFSDERLAFKLAGGALIVGSGFIILRSVA